MEGQPHRFSLMGSFNTLTTETICPVCNHIVVFDIQFKYGDTWQHHFKLGQKITWGGNDIGIPNKKKVLVEGIGGPCSNCKTEFLDFNIVISFDEITDVIPLKKPRESLMKEGYLITES